MSYYNGTSRFLVGLPVCLMILSASGCGVAVPTRPAVEIARSQPVQIDEDTLVSLGPRRLLENLSEEITEAYPDIEIVDGLLFRDTAFPQGGWKLATLFEPGLSRRVSEKLNVDYLVLAGALKTEEGKEEGFLVPLLAGAMSIESASTISAVIMDLRTGTLVSRLECKARGKTRMVYYVLFIAGTGPTLESGVTEGLAREIGKVITELSPPGRHRVALLALEYPHKTGQTGEAGSDNALAYPEVRREIYAHRSDQELRAAAGKGAQACHGEPERDLQAYFNLVQTDPAAAHRALCASADAGHPEARYRLALLYENGAEGFATDPVQAYVWYVLAGESGKYPGGRQALRLKQEVLSPRQIADAQQAVQAWQPGQCERAAGLPPAPRPN